MKRWASLTLVSMLLSGLAAAACDVEAIKAKAAERAQSSQSTAVKVRARILRLHALIYTCFHGSHDCRR